MYPVPQPYGINNFNPYQNMISQNNDVNAVNNLIRVTGMDGAKAYQMAPNSSVALFDSDSDIMYVKTTDGAGFPTIKTFRFEPIENTPPQTDYITRDEFEQLRQEVEKYGKQSVSKTTEKSSK